MINIMSIVGEVVGKISNLFRARWQRELISTGLEGKDGSLTEDGRNVVLRLLAEKAYNDPYTDENDADHESMRKFIGEGLVKRNKEIAAEREEK